MIEVIGMPAVGKSTCCNKMINKHPSFIDANGTLPTNHLLRQMYKFFAGCCSFLQHPKVFIEVIRIIMNSKQNTLVDFMKVCSNWFLLDHMMQNASKNPEKIYVFDQGVFQAGWSILLSSTHSVPVADLFGCIKMPSKVIFLDEPNEVLRDREAKRNKKIRLNYNSKVQVKKARDSLNAITVFLAENYESGIHVCCSNDENEKWPVD